MTGRPNQEAGVGVASLFLKLAGSPIETQQQPLTVQTKHGSAFPKVSIPAALKSISDKKQDSCKC